MILQLRTYTLRPGAMAEWIAVWRDRIKPVREGLGFVVPEAWSVPEKNQFIWIMGYDGDGEWSVQDQAFHDSPERKAIDPDPAGLIEKMETCFLEPVD